MDSKEDEEFDKKLIKEFEKYYENNKKSDIDKLENPKNNKKLENNEETDKKLINEFKDFYKNNKKSDKKPINEFEDLYENNKEFDKKLIKEFKEYYENKLETNNKELEIKNDLEEFDDKEYPEHEIKFDEDIINEFKEIYNNLDESKKILNELNEIYETLKDNDTIQDNLEYPEIELETDDLKVNLTLKKDYSKIKDINKRKTEFFKDLIDFIEEFRNTKESDELMEYYNKKEES